MLELIDFKELKRPASPNTALLAPAGFSSASPDGAAPIYDIEPGELYLRVLHLIGERDDWQLGAQDVGNLHVNFVAVTRLLRFKDDVDVIVLPAPGQPGKSTFAAYSRSRAGFSDLGTNRKRLEAFATALKAPSIRAEL